MNINTDTNFRAHFQSLLFSSLCDSPKRKRRRSEEIIKTHISKKTQNHQEFKIQEDHQACIFSSPTNSFKLSAMSDKLNTSVSSLSSSTNSEPKDEEEDDILTRNLKITRSSSWAYWNCYTPPKTPDSPSPVISGFSPDSFELPISNAASEPFSPVSTVFSTPSNQRSLSDIDIERGSRSLWTEGFCSKDSYQKNKQIVKGKSVRTLGKRLSSDSTTSMGKSSELNNPRSSIQSLLNVIDQQSIEGNNVSTVGDSDNDEQQSNTDASQLGERYFHNFISGIRRGKVEMKLEEWREARSTKLKDRLRKKEASIDERGMQEIAKASADLKEIEFKDHLMPWPRSRLMTDVMSKTSENKLERKKQEAMLKTQKKIENTQRKAQLKKEKERRSTATEITKVSRVVDKISVVARLSWWKSLLNR